MNDTFSMLSRRQALGAMLRSIEELDGICVHIGRLLSKNLGAPAYLRGATERRALRDPPAYRRPLNESRYMGGNARRARMHGGNC
jgi:hypothetical protein